MEEELKRLKKQLFDLRMDEKLLSMDNNASSEQRENIQKSIAEIKKSIARIQIVAAQERLNSEEGRKRK